MIDLSDAWIAVAIMSAITIVLRALPLMISRAMLATPRMTRLNQALPLCVMVILVAHSLAGGGADVAAVPAKLLALSAVAISYWRWRNALLSVVIGLLAMAWLIPGS